MDLEFKILDYLCKFDNGTYIDITFVDENREALENTLNELKGKNLVILDTNNLRTFEAFGIPNQGMRCIKAKININGKIYFDSLHKNRESNVKNKKRKSWKLAYLFNF